MQKDPDNRYANADELLTDLRALRDGNTLKLAQFSTGNINTGAPVETKSKLALIIAAVAIIILAVAGAFFFTNMINKPRSSRITYALI